MISFGGSVGKGGRKLNYKATVQGNGNLLIGKAYTAMLDLQTGDEFEIKLSKKKVPWFPWALKRKPKRADCFPCFSSSLCWPLLRRGFFIS